MGQWEKGILALTLTAVLSGCGGASDGGNPSASTPVITNSAGATFTNDAIGDIQRLTFDNTGTTVKFTSPTDDYILVLDSTEQTGNALSVQLTKSSGMALDTSAAALVSESETSPAEDAPTQFHNYMREMESVIRESGEYAEVPPSSLQAGLTTAPSVGDTESFRILSTMNSISTYQEVPATLRVATSDLYIYVDEASGGDSVSDDDLNALAHYFGDIALPKERSLFGHESDINADGHIAIVMSCVVNGMSSSGGLVTGFFFPGDLYQRSAINAASNAREVFYVLKPDSKGSCGTPIDTAFAVNNILPGVLAHEYQHMTSFNQHVFKNRGSTEEAWLNECLSHFSEDITGFNRENPSRIKLFFSQPSNTPIVTPASPSLAERGACYTFLRYLYEQSPDGDAFISNLYSSPKTGVDNLQSAYNSNDPDFDEFPEFVSRWSIALSLSGTGMTTNSKYNYQNRILNAQTGSYSGVCVRCDAQDGRGTVLDGPAIAAVTNYPSTASLQGTASLFYRLNAPTSSLRLAIPAGSKMTGSLIHLTKN